MDSAAHGISRSRAAATTAVARSSRPTAARVRAPTSAVTPKQELMRRLRRTKILATLGPASSDRTVIADHPVEALDDNQLPSVDDRRLDHGHVDSETLRQPHAERLVRDGVRILGEQWGGVGSSGGGCRGAQP